MATFVLIPGAGGLAWEWHRLGPELEARGHTAVPIDLPAGDDGSGLAEYADWTAASIRGRTDVVLVAQSFGGFTAPLVCERAARRPDRSPERDDPEAGRDVRRMVVEHRPGWGDA